MDLKEIYETYIETAATVMAKAPAYAGLWGFGNNPKMDPCHMAFYESVKKYLQELIQRQPSEEEVFAAADWIICTAADHKGKAAYGYMFAAHGLCKDLVPQLTPAHCAELRDFYDAHYPKLERMPAQQDLYKLLKKRAKA